jgi:hypothetical protein
LIRAKEELGRAGYDVVWSPLNDKWLVVSVEGVPKIKFVASTVEQLLNLRQPKSLDAKT